MFTGIIEAIGAVTQLRRLPGKLRIGIDSAIICSDLHVGDSVAVNGVCLTVVENGVRDFQAEAVQETLDRSTLGALRVGGDVNLERALRADSRLGGHWVQGHVDCISRVLNIHSLAGSHLVEVALPSQYAVHVIPKGSIAMDGVSLTIADLRSERFSVAVIPHTWDHTTFHTLRTGSEVNLEFDLVGKYILRAMQAGGGAALTGSRLETLGY
jgi:riboflavin synthase